MIEAVILDVDGTLIDSNDAHAASWVEALAIEGLSIPFERIRPLIGMGGDHLLPLVSDMTEASEFGKQISETRARIFRDRYLKTLRPFPKVRDLLTRFKDQGLGLVVASSSGDDLLEALLERAGVADLVVDSTSKDDAEASKPEPDIIIAALRKARKSARNILMLGDTPYDVKAASRAGVRTVALESGGWGRAHLSRAIAVYRDTAHLFDEYQSSPFAPGWKETRTVGSQQSGRKNSAEL